jgi:hypothetical protein
MVAEAGFRVARIRYYTPLVGGVIENLLLRVVEQWMARRAEGRKARSGEAGSGGTGEERGRALRVARTAAKVRIARRGPVYAGLRLLTIFMKLDVVLFGRITSGPFFALLVKDAPAKRSA